MKTIAVTLDSSGNLIGSGLNLFSHNTGLAYDALSPLFNPNGFAYLSGQQFYLSYQNSDYSDGLSKSHILLSNNDGAGQTSITTIFPNVLGDNISTKIRSDYVGNLNLVALAGFSFIVGGDVDTGGTLMFSIDGASAHSYVPFVLDNLFDNSLTYNLSMATAQYVINGTTSVDFLNKMTVDNGGVNSIDWNGRILFDNNAGVSPSLDWNGRIAYDSSTHSSLDWQNRQLVGSWDVPNSLTIGGVSVIVANQTGNFITKNQTGNFVVATGYQNISGRKNFLGDFTVSGVGAQERTFFSQKNNNEFVWGLNVDSNNSDTLDRTNDSAFKLGMMTATGGGYNALRLQAMSVGAGNWSSHITAWQVDVNGNMLVNSGISAVNITGTNFYSGSTNLGAVFYSRNNISGFLTGVPTGISSIPTTVNAPSGNLTIDWLSNNSFQFNISGNTTFGFAGCSNGQTIVVGVFNSGTYSVAWPSILSGTGIGIPSGILGVKWPASFAPTGSVSGKMDVYTFIDLNNTIYGNVVKGF